MLVSQFISPLHTSPFALAQTYNPATGNHIPGTRTPQGFWVVQTGLSHPGNAADIAAVTGTPLVAMASGTVLNAGSYGACGQVVRIEHAGDWRTKLCHMSQVFVAQGQHVRQGQVVGLVGSTGTSGGPHVHIELYDPRLRRTVSNPILYMGVVGTGQLALYAGMGLGVAAVLGGVYWASQRGL